MDVLTVLAFIGSVLMIVIVGSILAIIIGGDDCEMDEAERRDNGMLLQDEMQAAALLRKYNECRERMGRDCCLHPEYQFDEKHRQVVGRE